MTIRPAMIHESNILTTIALESKAHWGYTQIQLDSWTDDLTTTEDDIKNYNTFVILLGSSIKGFYTLIDKKTFGYIDKFFITANNIGIGLGNELMNHLFEFSIQKPFSSLKVHADPNAESFYSKYGFETFDYLASSVEGRYLPHMKKNF